MIERVRPTGFFVGVAALFATALCGTASAQTAQSCLADQLRAAARICKGYARCDAVAMQSGNAVDPQCFADRAQRLLSLFEEIEALAMGVCLIEGADADVATLVANGTDAMASALTLAGGHCASRKMGGLGRECSGYLRCYAKAAAHSSDVDPDCLFAYQQRLVRIFNKAEARGPCVTIGDRAAREAQVASLAADVFALLRTNGTTTTSSSSTTSTTTTTTTTTTVAP